MFGESGRQDGPVDDISTGQQATVTHTVGEADTALAVGRFY